jgi:hypothetical protein
MRLGSGQPELLHFPGQEIGDLALITMRRDLAVDSDKRGHERLKISSLLLKDGVSLPGCPTGVSQTSSVH